MPNTREKPIISQKVKGGEESICPKCFHGDLCRARDFQPCVECNRFVDANGVTVQDNTEISEELLQQLSNAPITILQEEPTIEVVQEWISVKDRLPEFAQQCLCYKKTHGHPEYRLGTYIGATFSDNCAAFKSMSHFGCIGATHWMPLPEPPKGE